MSEIIELLNIRHDLCKRLIKQISHIPVNRQYDIITSWMSVDRLTDLVEFQESKKDN